MDKNVNHQVIVLGKKWFPWSPSGVPRHHPLFLWAIVNNGTSDWETLVRGSLSWFFPPICHCFPRSVDVPPVPQRIKSISAPPIETHPTLITTLHQSKTGIITRLASEIRLLRFTFFLDLNKVFDLSHIHTFIQFKLRSVIFWFVFNNSISLMWVLWACAVWWCGLPPCCRRRHNHHYWRGRWQQKLILNYYTREWRVLIQFR